MMLTSSRSLGSAGASTRASCIAVRSLPLRVTLAMTLSLAMSDVMDSLCKDDGARDAHRECCGGEMSWSLPRIALTREYCTPKFFPGDCGGQGQGGSAAGEATVPGFRAMRAPCALPPR